MKLSTGLETVDQMQEVHFEGNVTPHTWYQNLLLKNKKPDLIGITILADIAYWYRPTYVYDDTTGQLKGIKKKFRADLLQRDYESFENRFGFSKKQIREAFDRLEDSKIVQRHWRTITTNQGMKANNVLFIELHVDNLKALTYSLPYCSAGEHPIDLEGNSLLTQGETPYCPTGQDPIAPEGNTNTKSSLEISTDSITTTKTGDESSPDDVDKLVERFTQLRNSGFPKADDYHSIKRTLAVVPVNNALELLESCFETAQKRGKKITVFSYCEPFIIERYEALLARHQLVDDVEEPATPIHSTDSIQYQLAERLLERIRSNNQDFKQPDLQLWSKDMLLMIRKDQRDQDQMFKVIDWCQDHSFWKIHILSASKLREKYDQLLVAAAEEKRRRNKPQNTRKDNMPKWCRKEQEDKENKPIPSKSTDSGKSFQQLLEESRRRKKAN
ncbi:hypothetical protein [Bacillus suaedae]|uniref:DnaD domain protein n=1 Tax=Halalkalibacter suaedae TaxID=2822140 RepID=A0A940WQ66_9BACI|nr:hypothetical protein [Bacillus suaedae]MBP3950311.1 hypothetical protein [Bacillus suaedae]